MKLLILIGLGLFIVLSVLIVISSPTEKEKIGSQDVYDRIDKTTDCIELQKEFDRAMDNAEWRKVGDKLRDYSLAYAEYSDKRMRELNCY